MKAIITGAVMVGILLLVACKSVQKSSTESTGHRRSAAEALTIQKSAVAETEWFGGTLTGRIPLSMPESGKARKFRAKGDGMELEFTLTDSTLEYKSVAEPVARSKLSSDSETRHVQSTEEEESRTSSKEKYKKVFSPWWMWPLILLIVAVLILRFVVKINFPFI